MCSSMSNRMMQINVSELIDQTSFSHKALSSIKIKERKNRIYNLNCFLSKSNFLMMACIQLGHYDL